MVSPKREGFDNDDKSEGSDRRDRTIGGDSSPEPMEADESASSGRRGRVAGCLTERLRGVLRDESDGDLLLDRSDLENGIAQWLRALDLQVLGACRADERLNPLLKLDISNGVAEDRLMAHLSQHFDASEIGMLARCLCIPLVSIRAGKVNKQGNLLCPTSTRGHLNLTLLPSSNMRISFNADDGCTERLAILSNNFDSSEVTIEEISADISGRSFLLKLPGSQILYFWCSEKSKLLGMELLGKMKDLLRRKPTLSHLTGIHESRLESFASHFREFFVGSSNCLDADPIASSIELVTSLDVHSPLLVFNSSCQLTTSYKSEEQPPLDGNLYPRPIICKDGTTSSSSFMGNGTKDKLRQHGDLNNLGSFINTHTTYLPLSAQTNEHSEIDSMLLPFATQTELNCPPSASPLPLSISPFPSLPPPAISSSNSLFSPYYCWCPPCPSSLQYSTMTSHLPTLPPLSSLLSLAQTPASLVTSNLPLDVPNFPALDMPSLLAESFTRLPLPVSSITTLPTSQQISTFTPFMSDPIVHIPVIDICSSGQGYLVSGGPAISSVIPPLIPKFVNHPLIQIQHTESAAEKSARETLRMLLASTPPSTCQKAMNILPPSAAVNVFTNVLPSLFLGKTDEKLPPPPGSNPGSRGLCGRTPDSEAVEMNSSSPSRALMGIGDHDSMEDFTSGVEDSEGCHCEADNLVDQELADNNI